MNQKRRSPHEAGNGHTLAGWVPRNHTAVRPLANDLSRGLAVLADSHTGMPSHELEWTLWSLFDCARELQSGLRKEGAP